MAGPRPSLVAAGAGLAVVAALSGCATTPQAPPPPGQWQGRFSVTVTRPPTDQSAMQAREERATGRFSLARDAAGRIDLELFSPFGQTLAQARARPGRATLSTHDGRVFDAADPDSLVERALGWRLPVAALPDLLAGRNPDLADWQVRVERRFDNGAPQTLQADWPAQAVTGQQRLRLRLVVDGGGA